MKTQLPRLLSPLGALTAALLGLLLLTAPLAQAAPFAYITNSRSNNVSVIDTASNTVVATVAVGTGPNGVAVNSAGTRVYVANSGSHTVSVIDTSSNTVTATFFVGSTPVGVAVNPAGTRVYVANLLSNSVSVIDTASNTVIATVSVGWDPFGVAVNPAGTRVYVTNSQSGTIKVIDTASNTVIATVPVGTNLYGMAVTPDGTRIYVTNPLSNKVSVIDTASNTVTATVGVGTDPYGVAVNPAGTRVYVTNVNSNNVSVIDTASNTVTATVPVGFDPFGVAVGFPHGVAVTPDGTRVYVTNINSNNVSVIETACNTVTATVAVGNSPFTLGLFIRPGAAPPPVVGPNLRVTGMEVTQAIQDLSNSVPLVSGRRTFVRVYVQSDGPAVPGVTATLSGAGSYRTVGGEVTVPLGSIVPVNTVGPRITVRPLPKRSNLNDSFLFELPWNWTNFEALRLHAVLSADPGPPPQSCPADLLTTPLHEFEMPMTLKIAFVRLGYQTPGVFPNVGVSAQTSLAEQSQSESWIRRTYPLSNLLSTPDFPLFDAGLGSRVDRSALECLLMNPEEQSLCAHRYITSRLAALQASSGFMGDADAAYGLIPQVPTPAGLGSRFTRGACCTNRIGAGPSNVADYAAHEMGHFFGRMHPGEGAGECGHTASDLNYPYWLSFIGPGILGPVASTHPETDLAGFDGGDASLLIPMGYIYGQNGFDIMGYCKPSWISDYTYKSLYICLSALNSDLPGVTPGCGAAGDTRPPPSLGPEMGDWLMVFGNITPTPATAAFIQTQRVDRIVSIPPRTPGGHSIRLLGAGGATLADYPFVPEAVEEGVTAEGAGGPLLSFGHVVPFVPGTQEIQIIDSSTGNTVIGAKTVSANPPAISIVALQGGPDPVTGPLIVEWEASDSDGDPLEFDVFLMRDGGALLQPLMLGLSGTSVQIDTARLGAGIAQFRVVATDGVQSAFADTSTFTLASKPPRPRILTPGDGTTVYLGQSVNLEGEATDPQDGVVPETGLAWSIAEGLLGSGGRLSISDLSAGANRITLTATNSFGLSDTTSVSITVKEALSLPGPTLTAGPGQIGWHVGTGESRLQSAELDIGNSGGGDLEFTAFSSAPWLTLSAPTGTAPATLTLTADPIGFGGGVTKEAEVILAAVGIPGQVITVPVRLSVGNTFVVGNTTNPAVNHAPTANAGPDQTVTATSCSGATVTLDGSASSDRDGDPLTFSWTGPFGDAYGPNPTVELPLGEHSITLTIDDGRGGGASDTLRVTVNDVVMFLSSTDAVTVPEGGMTQFQVKLSNQPCADVAVSVTRVGGDADITVQSGGTLTFSPTNWNAYQAVILAATEDNDVCNGTAAVRLSATGIPNKDVAATEADNDVLAFVTDANTVTVPEGGTAQFQVNLSYQPCADVTVSVTRVGGDVDITVQSGGTLTFNPTNWNVYQSVTLAAAEDNDGCNGTAAVRLSATGIPNKDVTATEADNDVLAFVTDTNAVTVPEGGTTQFQVKLSYQPCADVAVSVTRVGGDADITVQSGAILTFTTSNWNTYQTVTLSAAEDLDITDGTAAIRISAIGIPSKDITATESDNDVAQPLPFVDDFSTDKGWFGFRSAGWERAPAKAGGGEYGNPDPATDHSSTGGNYILGFAIGGDYPDSLGEESIISPPIDCSSHEDVFLKFRRWLNVEGNKGDQARVHVSNDGSNWHLVWANPAYDLTDEQWIQVVIDISEYAKNQSTVYVKFTMGPTNGSRAFSGWNIDDFEVASESIYPAEGTAGTEIWIPNDGYGLKKGKVYVGTAALKVLSWTDAGIQCVLSKVLPAGVYDLKILPEEPKGADAIVQDFFFSVMPPDIESLSSSSGKAGDKIIIKGKFFGMKKPKVTLGGKACKVVSWTMDTTLGDSEIDVIVPAKLNKGAYDLKVTNKTGQATEIFSID